jgi:hypothetical protein
VGFGLEWRGLGAAGFCSEESVSTVCTGIERPVEKLEDVGAQDEYGDSLVWDQERGQERVWRQRTEYFLKKRRCGSLCQKKGFVEIVAGG